MQFKKRTIGLLFAVALVFITLIAGNTTVAAANDKKGAGSAPVFNGGKSTWHGFTRYHVIMNDKTLAVTPFKAPRGEGDGIGDPPRRTHRCIIVVPKTFAPGNPWVFRADFVGRSQRVDLALLARGYYIVTGPVPARWDATYKYLTSYGFSKKPIMEGDGAAGEAHAWAMANPDKVSCIYGANPIVHSNLSKIPLLDSLGILARAGIPLVIVSGNRDPSFKRNTLVIEKRYSKLGGKIKVIVNKGQGHYPLCPKDPKPVVDFILKASLD